MGIAGLRSSYLSRALLPKRPVLLAVDPELEGADLRMSLELCIAPTRS
jgi:hypothetical protein